MIATQLSPSATEGGHLTPLMTRTDHILGRLTAPVALIVYGDYECPLCRMAQPVVKAAVYELRGLVCFGFRHYPLSELHPHAQHAAEVAEAAGAQGMFWQMHDLLFERQRALEDVDLLHYAQRLDLDVDRVARELRAGVYESRVHDDFQSGIASGVKGTPTFFVNGARFDGWWPDAGSFTRVLRSALQERLHEMSEAAADSR